MKAYTTLGDGIDALRLIDREIPAPAPHEVLVRMRAATLNYRDLLVVNGVEHWKPGEPRVPLSDGVGIVEAVGRDVTRVARGDRVAGIFHPRWLDGALRTEVDGATLGGASLDGVLTEFRLFHSEQVVVLPAHLSDAEGAALPVAAVTAWHALARRARVVAGETVLIQGTGGVSLFALQIAAALGARPIVTSSSDAKLERARALGAAETINYTRSPEWEQDVLRWTGGRGVDHVVEVVGGENLNRSLRAVRLGGSIAFIGLIAGLRAPIDTYQFVMRNVTIHGIETGSREMFEELNAFLARHRLQPVLDRTFPFDDVRAAMRYLESGTHFGKIAVAFA